MTDLVARLEGVTKVYGSRSRRSGLNKALPLRSRQEAVVAVNDLTVEVRAGENLGILGPNGAGKSTVLKLLAGITAPTQGRICTRGRIASLIELGVGFHPDLTGRENVRFTATLMGLNAADLKKIYDEVVEFSGIARVMDVQMKRYSSGMRARLGFSLAAHLDADILLVDEVLAVGDADFQRKCAEKMSDLRAKGVTHLVVSHNLWTLAAICDRALVLDSGRLVDEGPAGEVVDRYATVGWGDPDGLRPSVTIGRLTVDPDKIVPGQDLTIRTSIEVEHAIKEGVVRALIVGPAGRPLAEALIDPGTDALSQPGSYEISGRVGSVPFLSGGYRVVFEVLEEVGGRVIVRRSTPFEIAGVNRWPAVHQRFGDWVVSEGSGKRAEGA